MAIQKVLILYAHPSQHRSEVNAPLFEAAQKMDNVTCIDLYAEYPTFAININKEQQRLIEHDIIIFQFPLYWYSTPAIIKEWQDLVLEYGFAYGSQGKALRGKKFMVATSAGAKEEAYCAQGVNHFTIRQLFAPLEQMASLTGMTYLAPFILFGARTAEEEHRVSTHIEHYQTLLTAFTEDNIDIEKMTTLSKITTDLSSIIKTGTGA